jgi:SAM-dependent methyltransferase
MSSWTEGYVTDVPYVPGYYSDQSLEFIRFGQLLAGVRPSGLGPDVAYCELGFGLGITLSVLAGVHPEVQFWGTDFSSSQLMSAADLGGDLLPNLTLADASFEEFAHRDTPRFDFISLHGIWSWVSPENHGVIVRMLRDKLKPGGAVYISYNAMPGWSFLGPLRALLFQHSEFLGAPGQSATSRARDGLAFVAELEKNQVPLIVGNPALTTRLAQVRQGPLEYAAHEYLNRHHVPKYFSEVEAALADARLSYVGTGRVLNALDGINLSQAAQQHLAAIKNPTFREVIRDFYTTATFRQDIFARGVLRLTAEERRERLDAVRLFLATPAPNVPMKITGALGEITMHEAVYGPLLEKLWAAGSDGLTLGEVRSTGQLKSMPAEAALEATCMLIAQSVVFPVVDPRANPHPEIARSLAMRMLERCEKTGQPQCMPSPITRNGHAVDRVHASFILGYQDGLRDKKGLARRAWKALEKAGQRVMKDGKPLATEQENLADLESKASAFLADGKPSLERLGLL